MRGDAEPLRHLPREWMYRAPLPRTKLESPLPSATFDGSIDGRRPRARRRSTGWRGMAGHNWGAEHAATWIWLHGIAFAGEPGAWLDLSVGRVRVGPLLTPWIANGALQAGGERTAARRPAPRARDRDPGGLPRRARRARSSRRAPPPARPSPGPTPTRAAASTTRSTARSPRCTRRGSAGRELRTAHGGVYEFGVAPGAHGVELQPFPDG